METTTEIITEATAELSLAVAYNNQLLESVLAYIQVTLVLVVGVLLYKSITAFTGT